MVCLSPQLRSPATAQSNGGKFRNSLTPFTAQAYGLIAYLIGIADGELTVSRSYLLVASRESVPPLILVVL